MELCDRSVTVTRVVEARSEVGSGTDIFRIDLQRLLVIVGRRLELMRNAVDASYLVEQVGILRIVFELGEQALGLLVRHLLHLFQTRHGFVWPSQRADQLLLAQQPERLATTGVGEAEPRTR